MGEKMAKYRLGLDLGSTSVGWAAYALDEQDEPVELLRAGSHIFSDSRDPQNKTSLKAERRAHRQPQSPVELWLCYSAKHHVKIDTGKRA